MVQQAEQIMNPFSITTLFDTPVGGLTLTLLAYLLALALYQRGKQHPLFNPSVWATAVVLSVVLLFGIPYKHYLESASIIAFLLKPATIGLAVPLYRHQNTLRHYWKPLTISLLFCFCLSLVSSVGLAWLMGASHSVLLSMAPKSVTAVIAMGISQTLGGIPSLTIVFTMITGLGGSLFSPLLFKYFNIQHPVARGFAIGSISHGTGTAVAYQHYGEKEGALSSLGMVMHGILAAFLFPWIAMLMGIPLH